MKINISKFSLAYLKSAVLSLVLVACLSACKKDDAGSTNKVIMPEFEEYSTPTEDALRVVSEHPAYIIPYEYDNFGKALVNRLQNKVTEINYETLADLATVVLHSSQIMSMEDDWMAVLVQLLLGRNIIIVEPRVQDFNYFCDVITITYILLQESEVGRELLDELDIIPGARQTLEAFYDLSMNPSKLESMFLLNTDQSGIFAEAIAVRGCDFHIVDRMNGVAESEVTHEQIVDEEGNTEPIETPEVENATGSTPSDVITPYSYGLFGDMVVKWMNDHYYFANQVDDIRNRGIEIINSRATETSKYNLEDITSVQKVQYTINAATPYDVGPKLPVTVSFEICSIYMEQENCDYYCIYKNILSYNQVLDCGPSGEENKREWRKSYNFGEPCEDLGENIYAEVKGWMAYPYYGPFMRDIEGRSICHAHTDSFVDSATSAVDLPNANSIKSVAGVAVEKYSPKNSIGSVDETNGFSYGFDFGLYLAKEPAVNLGYSVSYDSSTTQSIDDLDIIASTSNGIPEWKYIGQNLPDVYFNLVKAPSHSEVPSIMRLECEVDQSWIWKVPNPTGSYRLFDETSVTTSIMYYNIGFLKAYAKFANHTTTKRVSFLMIPPPRSEQLWMMNVTPYSDELNSMLATTHSRFWNKSDHEFKLTDTSEDSRISIEQFIRDFQRDLNSKRHTWKNRNFKGTFTFSYYNVNEADNEPISFDFVVE